MNLSSVTTLSDATYDRLKFLALVVLPGLGTLYFTVAMIWGLPKAEEVVGTIVAVDTFLGLLLGLSNKAYNENDDNFDGTLTDNGANPDSLLPNLQLTITKDPREVVKQKVVRLKVPVPPDNGDQ